MRYPSPEHGAFDVIIFPGDEVGLESHELKKPTESFAEQIVTSSFMKEFGIECSRDEPAS